MKVFCVGQTEVLEWFRFASEGWPQRVALPLVKGLPKGVRVLAVQSNFMNRQFEFLVEHESFEPVAEGLPAPFAEGQLHLEFFVVDVPPHTQEK